MNSIHKLKNNFKKLMSQSKKSYDNKLNLIFQEKDSIINIIERIKKKLPFMKYFVSIFCVSKNIFII